MKQVPVRDPEFLFLLSEIKKKTTSIHRALNSQYILRKILINGFVFVIGYIP